MNLSKDQISKIISIVIMAAIALLAVFGYDVIIVQPQLRAMRGQPQAVGSQAVLGPYYENLNVGKDFHSFGQAEINAATVTTLTATTVVSQAVAFSGTGDGTAAAPAYTFANDANTGLYRIGVDDTGVSAGGTLRFDVSANAVTSTLPVVAPAGAVDAPSLTFASDRDSGLYRIAANNVGVGVNGAKVLDVGVGGLGVVGVTTIGNGAVGAPGLAFTSDTDSGLYRVGANDIGVGVAGAKVLDVDAGGLAVTGVVTASVVGAEITASGGLTVTGATILNGGLAMDSTAFTVADTSGNVNTAGTLAIGSVTFTGPVKYGTAATYTSGANIVHGFSVTPTMCMLWPAEITATVTMTATAFSSNTATHSTPVMWMCGK